MALPTVTGIIDPVSGFVVPKDTSAWADYSTSTWANFVSWNSKPANPMVWVSNLADLGSIQDFNILISATYSGTITYDVYVSTTGQFKGEETVTTITEGDENIPSFHGRYVLVAAKVYKGNSITTLQSLTFTSQRKTFDILKTDIESSSLAGSATGRIIDLGRTVSKVLTVELVGRAPVGAGYVVDDYIATDYFASAGDYMVNDYWTSGYVESSAYQPMSWPFLVSKDKTGPVVCIRNENGDYIDGEFDARITVLPEQYMSNGQILTR